MTSVAIVGMAVLLPAAADLDAYQRNLVRGVDAITEIPQQRWGGPFAGEVSCRRGGFVDEVAEVDLGRLGLTRSDLTRSELAGTEPDQLIALHVAAGAVADAGGRHRLGGGGRVGVILGRGGYLTPGLVRLDQQVRTAHQLVASLRELCPGLGEDRLAEIGAAFTGRAATDRVGTDRVGTDRVATDRGATGLVPNLTAARIAHRLDLHGPAYTVDAACASSLVAVEHAVRELAGGRCDAVLAGGVHHSHDITLWSAFSRLRALSAGQQARPFDRRADGMLIGEGTGVVVLKRLADAQRAGDRIYAVIRGAGVSSDGRGPGLLEPSPAGQVLAVRRAWDDAGLDPARPGSLGLLEAHGTGSPAGDRAELAAVREVFGGPGTGDRPVIGSVKSMIGHTMPAAGIAALVKAALALHHQVLLPTLHCEEPAAELAASRFRPLPAAQPWELDGGQTVRRAAVSAFGFGGVNAHLVLEESGHGRPLPPAAAVPAQRAAVREPERVLLLAASSPAELGRRLDVPDADLLAAVPGGAVPGAAAGGCRLGVPDPTPKRLALARRAVGQGLRWSGRGEVWFSPRPLLGPGGGQVAFLFPGLEADFSPRLDDVARWLGVPPPELSTGSLTDHGRSVLAAGRLLDEALRRLRIVPGAVAGHSIGEWVAMTSGGLVTGEALDVMISGGRLEGLRVPGVAFASLGCDAQAAAQALSTRPGVMISHENSPRQTVVCGPPDEVEDVVRQLRAGNVICRVLPFRSGFHTPLLEPYLGPFRAAARGLTVRPAAVPVWSATTGEVFPADPDAVRELYLRHLLEPVRFAGLLAAMHRAGARVFVQAGPGQLAALVDDTLRGSEQVSVAANVPSRPGLDQLLRVATAVWVAGGEPAFDQLRPDPGHGRAGARVRLELGSPLVSLAGAGLLPVPVPAAAAGPGPASALDALGERVPEARELAELMRETAEVAVALLAPRPHPEVQPEVQPEVRSTLRVSTRTMPYLLDHCFAPQRDGWPDESDRRPVVPATTMVQHMVDAARAAAGREVAGLQDVRFTRWLVASPPVDVTVTVRPAGPDRLAVSLDGHASGTVLLAGGAAGDPPAAWPAPPAERRPGLSAQRLYSEQWMFHGPGYQGVTELTAVSAEGVRALITVPDAPGALLDNVGQALTAWIAEYLPDRQVALPVRFGAIRFHRPPPPPGARVAVQLRVRSVDAGSISFDAQVSLAGAVAITVTGWQDQRFDCDEHTTPAYRFPDRHLLSTRQPGGWYLTAERWPSLAGRELCLAKYLNAPERAQYARCSPRRQRQWLLGRIAVKDAVRDWLWRGGSGPVFPAELLVGNEPTGRPQVSGQFGFRLPELQVSLAHRRELGVALVRPAAGAPGPGVGIDVEEIAERPEETVRYALTPAERELLDEVAARTGEPPPEGFTRFWAAKEAAAKAEGTGLQGVQSDFAVAADRDGTLLVDAWPGTSRARRHRIRTALVSNPDGLPPRRYAVAWTDQTDHEATGIEVGEES